MTMKMRLEMDHWVLFDTLGADQIGRLKEMIHKKVAPVAAPAKDSADSFLSMLNEETEKLK